MPATDAPSLAQAAHSVRRNLGERWVAPFFAAYGIDRPDAAKRSLLCYSLFKPNEQRRTTL